MIKLENLCKKYGDGDTAVEALKDVNIEIENGKMTAIIGKSGSGKTTLMNIIGALDSPTSGKIIINGKDISELNSNELAKYRNKSIGFVFQSYYLEPTFSVLENVCMPLTIAGIDKKNRELKGTEVIQKLGLLDKSKKKANQLSGGQKQRVSIARALVNDPDIILADEPTGNLDSENGIEVMKILRNIVSMGKTVIIVTHDMDNAKLADNLIEIIDGVATPIVGNNNI